MLYRMRSYSRCVSVAFLLDEEEAREGVLLHIRSVFKQYVFLYSDWEDTGVRGEGISLYAY